MSGTDPEVDPEEPRRRGGLWDAVDDIEHVAGQTEPATAVELPPVRPAPPAVELPPVRPGPPAPSGVAWWRSHLPHVAAGLAMLVLAVATIVVLATDPSAGPAALPGPTGAVPGGAVPGASLGGGGGPGPTMGAGPTDAAGPGATASPPSTVNASPPPTSPAGDPARLLARYATIRRGALGVSGYTGQVRISNPGGVTVSGWQVVITLPEGASVSDASGARAEQRRSTVTFTPADNTRDVGGGASVEFTFDVNGLLAGEPTGCAIDGHPCD